MDVLKNIFHSKNLTIPLPSHSPTFNYLRHLPLSSPPTTFFTSTLMNHHRISGKSLPPRPCRFGEPSPIIFVFDALVHATSSHWTTTTSSTNADDNYLASDSTCEEARKRVDEDIKLHVLCEAQCESEGTEAVVN